MRLVISAADSGRPAVFLQSTRGAVRCICSDTEPQKDKRAASWQLLGTDGNRCPGATVLGAAASYDFRGAYMDALERGDVLVDDDMIGHCMEY
jgi:hypothetical protein